jgi:protein-S-isoprenylcysteine O-methyltransferase Ste14
VKRLARWRVPLGFAAAAVAFALARPSRESWAIGVVIAAVGESLRVWAAGHLEKGREITRSGPYRFVRHPLYLGSTLLAVGFAAASRSLIVAAIAALYLSTTVVAAIRSEEAELDAAFRGGYSEYRNGRATPVARPFRWSRAVANREYRAMAGFVAAFVLLALEIG